MSDEFCKDPLRRCSQVACGGFEVLVVLARDPELQILFAEFRLEKFTETLSADCRKHTQWLNNVSQRKFLSQIHQYRYIIVNCNVSLVTENFTISFIKELIA